MNRWKVAGTIMLLFLALLAFTIVQSCRRVNEPTRMEDDPETLGARALPAPHGPDAAPGPAALRRPAMQQITV